MGSITVYEVPQNETLTQRHLVLFHLETGEEEVDAIEMDVEVEEAVVVDGTGEEIMGLHQEKIHGGREQTKAPSQIGVITLPSHQRCGLVVSANLSRHRVEKGSGF